MADYHQIVEQIRGFLQASDQTRNERLEGLASAYSEACVEVNQRLSRCQRLLQQGLRSEAIQLAESEPRLLDAVVALDFAERPEWDELVGIYSLAAAPKLVVEAKGALSGAYAEAEPLQDLLRNHRRLATQRALLRTRIAVMRKLMALDARNPIWADDLKTFEKARLKQIQVEATEAVRLHDGAHVARLLSEIQDASWLEPPPKGLLQGLTKADAQFRGEQTRTAITDIEARLSDALTSNDLVRGRAARDEWTALTKSAPVDPGDPCWERVGPALKWLEDEDRKAVATEAHEASMSALSTALEDRRPISAAELERLESDVLRHARGMPEKLQRRYAARFRSASAKRSRRARVLVAAAIAVLLLAGGLAFVLISGNARKRSAEEAAVTVDGLLESGDFEQAERFLDNLEKVDAGLVSHPILVEARQHCKTARTRDADRARKFELAMQEAQNAPLEEIEPKALTEANALARLEAEKQAVAQLIRQRDAARKEASEKGQANLRQRLEPIIRDVDRLDSTLGEARFDQARFQEVLDGSRLALSELARDVAVAGEDLQRSAAEVKQKLESVAKRFEQLVRQSRLKEEITSAVAFSVTEQSDSLSLFASRLRDYVRAFPGESCSAAFEKTLNERPLWDAVAAWNALVSRWKNERGDLTPREAELRSKACGEFLQKYPEFPGNTGLKDYRRYVQAIARRTPGSGSPVAALQNLCSNPLLDRVWMVVIRAPGGGPSRERYYTHKEPVAHGELLQFRSILKQGDKEEPRGLVLASIFSKDLSPQSRFIAQLKPILFDQAKLDRWESLSIDLVKAILNEHDMDPVLQVVLLKRVVKAAADGSEPIRISLESMANELERTRVDLKVDWTNPDAPHLAESQEGARKLIASLGDKVPTATQVTNVRGRLEGTVRQTYRTTGWLIRKGDAYEVRTGAALPGDGDLQVVAPSALNRAEWKKVGDITAGKLNLNTTDRSALVEGRPVFGIDRAN